MASAATNAANAHDWGALDSSRSSCWYLSTAGFITVIPGTEVCHQSYTLLYMFWRIVLACEKNVPSPAGHAALMKVSAQLLIMVYYGN